MIMTGADEAPPPSYESVLNEEYGDSPRLRPPSPPLPPIPVPTVYQHSQALHPPLAQRQRAASRPSQQQPPSAATIPEHTPPIRRRSHSESRPRPCRPRRATSPARSSSRRESGVQREPRHTQSLPRLHPRPKKSRSPESAVDLVALVESRRSSIFASNKKTARIVRASVLEFVSRLEVSSEPAEMLITLDKACTFCNLRLGTLLREGRIRSHSPLYWAIVNGCTDSAIKSLLSYAPGGIDEEIRLAALTRADWKLYQRIRTWVKIPGRLTVEEKDEKRFVVYLQDVSRQHGAEFFARGRLWRLAFPAGSVILSLVSQSPQTFVDGNLRISSSHQVQIPLKAPHQLHAPDRRGRTKEAYGIIEDKVKINKATLEVKMAKPEDDSGCVIC